MNTIEFIKQYQQKTKKNQIQFKVINSDAIILNGRYAGMKLSDIFIVYPKFLDWIIGDNRIDPFLKAVAKDVKTEAMVFADNITREIFWEG